MSDEAILAAYPVYAAPPVQEAGRETFVKRLRELSSYFRREGRPVGGFTPYQAALECAKDVDALADEMETEK